MTLRLFVALDLPDEIRETLSTLTIDRDTWRPVRPESLHVTLAFLGARPESDVARIAPIITAETQAPELTLGAARRFSRVLAVELEDPTGALHAMQARIAAALGYDEGRPFRPHVTIARPRPRTRPRDVRLDVPPRTFHGRSVTLYASRLHPSGARYEPLATGYIQP